MRQEIRYDCAACRDSGWVPFTRVLNGSRMPWAAACRCSRGRILSSHREHAQSSTANGKVALPPPVVVEPIDQEIYYARLSAAVVPPIPNPEAAARKITGGQR